MMTIAAISNLESRHVYFALELELDKGWRWR